MSVKDLFEDCVLGVRKFFLDGFKGDVHVLVAEGKDGADDWVYYSSVGGVDLDDASQGFYHCCVLDIGLLVLFL